VCCAIACMSFMVCYFVLAHDMLLIGHAAVID
jgi:hypothetical protein